jgi:hypothetical protein
MSSKPTPKNLDPRLIKKIRRGTKGPLQYQQELISENPEKSLSKKMTETPLRQEKIVKNYSPLRMGELETFYERPSDLVSGENKNILKNCPPKIIQPKKLGTKIAGSRRKTRKMRKTRKQKHQ